MSFERLPVEVLLQIVEHLDTVPNGWNWRPYLPEELDYKTILSFCSVDKRIHSLLLPAVWATSRLTVGQERFDDFIQVSTGSCFFGNRLGQAAANVQLFAKYQAVRRNQADVERGQKSLQAMTTTPRGINSALLDTTSNWTIQDSMWMALAAVPSPRSLLLREVCFAYKLTPAIRSLVPLPTAWDRLTDLSFYSIIRTRPKATRTLLNHFGICPRLPVLKRLTIQVMVDNRGEPPRQTPVTVRPDLSSVETLELDFKTDTLVPHEEADASIIARLMLALIDNARPTYLAVTIAVLRHIFKEKIAVNISSCVRTLIIKGIRHLPVAFVDWCNTAPSGSSLRNMVLTHAIAPYHFPPIAPSSYTPRLPDLYFASKERIKGWPMIEDAIEEYDRVKHLTTSGHEPWRYALPRTDRFLADLIGHLKGARDCSTATSLHMGDSPLPGYERGEMVNIALVETLADTSTAPFLPPALDDDEWTAISKTMQQLAEIRTEMARTSINVFFPVQSWVVFCLKYPQLFFRAVGG